MVSDDQLRILDALRELEWIGYWLAREDGSARDLKLDLDSAFRIPFSKRCSGFGPTRFAMKSGSSEGAGCFVRRGRSRGPTPISSAFTSQTINSC
jgi:hypothetical protein